MLDPAKLDRSFISKEQGNSKGVAWLQITPRNADAAFKTARLGFSAGNLSQLDYVDALGQRTVIAVSYTHLDVYKRQKLMSAVGVRNLAGFNKKVKDAIDAGQPMVDPLFKANPDPVSYTHLDVYKRQNLSCMIFSARRVSRRCTK